MKTTYWFAIGGLVLGYFLARTKMIDVSKIIRPTTTIPAAISETADAGDNAAGDVTVAETSAFDALDFRG